MAADEIATESVLELTEVIRKLPNKELLMNKMTVSAYWRLNIELVG